jgi:hypothetical protein
MTQTAYIEMADRPMPACGASPKPVVPGTDPGQEG